ncbi:hypothetical protein LCL97_14390 [Seohaeicola saemankumensis]|nr:hypothetical protein [Seohaeicola saemankumensis]MCA0872025.1 hypothetical protein [Seohaeicola saemankumensis]
MKTRSLALVICGGVAVGVLSHWLLDRSVGRVESALALFQRHCVPFAGGGIVAPSSSLERYDLTGGLMFFDPDSRFVLSLSATHCAVSDIVDPIDPRDWPALKQGVHEMIERELPVLTFQGTKGSRPQRDRALWREEPLMEASLWGVSLTYDTSHPKAGLVEMRMFVSDAAPRREAVDRLAGVP